MAKQASSKPSANRRQETSAVSSSKTTKGKIDTKKTELANIAAHAKDAPKVKPAKITKQTGRIKTMPRAKKIDWDEAFQYYCEDMTRTYEDVAVKYKVAKDSVYKQSAKEDTPWPERRLSVVEKAQKRATKRRLKDTIERDESHLKSFRAAVTAHTNTIIREGNKNEQADQKALASATHALYKAIMGERVILGLPILIARSETIQDDDEIETPADITATANLLKEHLERLEKYRNNG